MTDEKPDLDFYDFLLEIRAAAPVCVKCGADLNIEGAKPGQYYRVKCDSVAHVWELLTAEPPLRMVDFRQALPQPDETARVSESVHEPAKDAEIDRLHSLLDRIYDQASTPEGLRNGDPLTTELERVVDSWRATRAPKADEPTPA